MLSITIETLPDPRVDAAVEAAMVETLRRRIKGALKMTYCHTHGRFPEITARGRVGTRFDFHVRGCCREFVRRVKWTLDEL